ncbi:MAG: DUF4179 domain-containing protein [Clostridiaceae bacterium]|nr:DUF4179 domain-containing protein [Clostridiaceae bacterium]
MNNYLDKLNDIEIDLEDLEIEPLSDIEKKKYKNNVKKSLKKKHRKYFKNKSVVAAAIVGVLFMSPLLSEAVSAGIEVVSKSIESLTGITDNEYEDYKDVVNQQINKDGYTVKLNEVMFDEDTVYISSTISRNDGKEMDKFCDLQPYEILANGKRISHAGGTYNDTNGSVCNQLIMYTLDKDINLSGDVNMQITYGKTQYESRDDFDIKKEGKWVFNFKTNTDKMKNNIKTIDIAKKVEIDHNNSINIDKVIVSPVGVRIKATIKGDSLEEIEQGSNYSFKVVDDLNNNIELDGTELENMTDYIARYKLVNKDASKLTITPVINKDGQSIEMNDSSFTVDLK